MQALGAGYQPLCGGFWRPGRRGGVGQLLTCSKRVLKSGEITEGIDIPPLKPLALSHNLCSLCFSTSVPCMFSSGGHHQALDAEHAEHGGCDCRRCFFVPSCTLDRFGALEQAEGRRQWGSRTQQWRLQRNSRRTGARCGLATTHGCLASLPKLAGRCVLSAQTPCRSTKARRSVRRILLSRVIVCTWFLVPPLERAERLNWRCAASGIIALGLDIGSNKPSSSEQASLVGTHC